MEQAYLSTKPPAMKGLELDFGKFVTSAGAEVIEAKDNWNYSRSILFAWAIPYLSLRSATPCQYRSRRRSVFSWCNGWNNVTTDTGGVTTGLTSALVKTKYTFNANVYTGPENIGPQHGYRNLSTDPAADPQCEIQRLYQRRLRAAQQPSVFGRGHQYATSPNGAAWPSPRASS